MDSPSALSAPAVLHAASSMVTAKKLMIQTGNFTYIPSLYPFICQVHYNALPARVNPAKALDPQVIRYR